MNIENKLAIHELLGRAAHGYDERLLDMLQACFVEEASMTIQVSGQEPVGPFNGRDAIMQLFHGSMATQTDTRRHVISNLFFHEEGDTRARLSSNLTLIATENGVSRLLSAGVYTDTVVKREREWRIVNRHLDLDSAF
jgi:3-phenylpropionate/cinnamic acid dioxygenase small subunit